jgi:hypothetical protein
MSVINEVIGPQSFEVVRDRIGRILADELAAQASMSGNTDLRVFNWIERFLPFDNPELPSVNVKLGEGTYGGQSQIQSDGTYRYYIDAYVKAKSHQDDPGDQKAITKLHRLLGVCRAIIEDPRYKTLGFVTPAGFIMNRHFESIQIQDPGKQEMESMVMGRLVLSVKVPEYPGGFVVGTAFREMRTTVMLDSTERGYLWIDRFNPGYRYFDFSFDSYFD